MKRNIITIDQDLCNGCGNCIPGCPEGALQVLDGKARLVSDLFCDGLGACLGECPVGAIRIEEREAAPYDETLVIANIAKQGKSTVLAHLNHLKEHGETKFLNEAIAYLTGINFDISEFLNKQETSAMACGCPGSMAREFEAAPKKPAATGEDLPSALTQWPVQLHLINPNAPYFKNAHLLVAADCVPFSYANFHHKLLEGKKLVILCPKLDEGTDRYIDKLETIFSSQNIQSVTIAHMEVPCCFGSVKIVEEALARSGKTIPVIDITISIDGTVKSTEVVAPARAAAPVRP